MLEQQHRDGDVADGVEAEHDHRARHRADAAAAGLTVMRRIDQAQNLVGEAVVLENRIGQSVDAFLVRSRHPVDRRYRIGQRGEIGLVPHPPHEEFQRVLLFRVGRPACLHRRTRRIEIFVEQGLHLRRAFQSLRGIAGHGAQHDGGQLLIHRQTRRQG